jgi:NIPSNAP
VAVKLLMTWDILPGREQEYFEFVVRDFIPGIQRMGMEPSDAWFTMYGSSPQILAAAQMPDMEALKKILDSPDWKELTQRLMEYVEHLDYKVVQARSGFQM